MQAERPSRTRLLAWVPWLALLFAVGDWLALKAGVFSHPPWLLAALVSMLCLALVVRASRAGLRAWRDPRRRVAAGCELLLIGGVLVALVAGMANWLLGLQGFIVLHEGETVSLHGGSQLQEIEAGPLARLGDMHWLLALREVELRPAGGGSFFPRSILEVQRGDEEPAILAVDSRHTGAAGALRFHQGAFGFAPRIVILRGGEQIFDRVVPFATERRGPTGVTFGGRFTIAAEKLEVGGTVDLASLDEGMRGHATLRLEVRRGDGVLGRGSLLPGHFAEMEEGYRVGFVGLKKWSEIDLSRRHYGAAVLAGAGMVLLGAALWPLARWRGW